MPEIVELTNEQIKLDRLENLLCNLTLNRQDGETISVGELRTLLKSSGIMGELI